MTVKTRKYSSIFSESKFNFLTFGILRYFSHVMIQINSTMEGEKRLRTNSILKMMDNFTHAKSKCALEVWGCPGPMQSQKE